MRVRAEVAQRERAVRRGGDRVDRDLRAGRVRGGDDPVELRHRARGVRRRGHGHPARAVGEHGLDRRRGQRERVAVGLRPADGRARALGGDHPRAHVGVVVQARDDDLVAGPERAADRGREPHRHRGHRRAEGHAGLLRAEEPRHRRAGALHARVGRVRGGEDAAVVGVVARAHERGHRLDRRVDHLRPGRPVQAHPAPGEPREAIAVHRRSSAARTSSTSCG